MLQKVIIFLAIAQSLLLGATFIKAAEHSKIESSQSQPLNITIFNCLYNKKFPEYIIKHPLWRMTSADI